MIDYQLPSSNKHIYIKIVAWIVLIVFTWNQIAYSWDRFDYATKATGVEKFKRSARERGQLNQFAPTRIQQVEAKAEATMGIKNDIEQALLEDLYRGRKPRDEAELPLKKKIGGDDGGGARYPDFILTEPPNDLPYNPHNLIQQIYGNDHLLMETLTFSITYY